MAVARRLSVSGDCGLAAPPDTVRPSTVTKKHTVSVATYGTQPRTEVAQVDVCEQGDPKEVPGCREIRCGDVREKQEKGSMGFNVKPNQIKPASAISSWK